MNEREQDWLHVIKKEADESLFEHMHFDADMKARVMRRIRTGDRSPSRTDRTDRLGFRKLWAIAASAAVMLAIVLFVAQWFPTETNPPSEVDVFATGGAGADSLPVSEPVTPIESGVIPLIDNGSSPAQPPDTNPLVHEPAAVRFFQDSREAAAWFGDAWTAAQYSPHSYELDTISGYEDERGNPYRLVFRYADGRLSYTVDLQLNAMPGMESANDVDINGSAGYFTPNPMTELIWRADNVLFTVSGHLTEEEALQVARSME